MPTFRERREGSAHFTGRCCLRQRAVEGDIPTFIYVDSFPFRRLLDGLLLAVPPVVLNNICYRCSVAEWIELVPHDLMVRRWNPHLLTLRGKIQTSYIHSHGCLDE